MEQVKTDLATVTYSCNNSNGTALVKALKDYAREYDSMLIHTRDIECIVKELRIYADSLLEEHRQWKDVEIRYVAFDYPSVKLSYHIYAGEPVLIVTPAKAFLSR